MKTKHVFFSISSIAVLIVLYYGIVGNNRTSFERTFVHVNLDTSDVFTSKNELGFKDFVINSMDGRIHRLIALKQSNDSVDSITYHIQPIISDSMGQFEEGFAFTFPKNARVRFLKDKSVYSYHRFGLYIVDHQSTLILNPVNVSIYDAYPLVNGNILCLGEIKDTNSEKFAFGFFELNESTNETNIKHLIREESTSTRSSDLLSYAGRFCDLGKKLAFVYERVGQIFFFDNNNGTKIMTLHTIDKTPVPETVMFGDFNTYKRGKAKLSNSAVLIVDKLIVVISKQPIVKEKLILDVYKDMKYQKSLLLKLDGVNSNDVVFFNQTESQFFLGTKKALYTIPIEQLLIRINFSKT
ncbi:hypothetical protein E2P86_09665 [Sphingobacterium psychroaquaticum]|uniref:hypothetical protein n=1 Tax=Sphingobacterium psychroaquaticum TaxID=561061 RepID=UPI00106B9D0C|nr:hypothetical protein [Sphingobacterium psychroaquaticum]QBQ41408.1 hypothetical protein E2P86_09665 [Sphingobacterium psychroaquaticum]